MKSLSKILVAIVMNAVALFAAGYFVSGFAIQADLRTFVIMAAVLTLLNAVVKPILTLVLGPIIIITLGLGLVFVNMAVLFILDKLFQNLTIHTIPALLYASLIIGIVNFVFHLATKE